MGSRRYLPFLAALTLLLGTCVPTNYFFPANPEKNTEDKETKPVVNPPPVISSVYFIEVEKSGHKKGDSVQIDSDSGKDGDTITLTYTLADASRYNLLELSGVAEPFDPVTTAGTGTLTYTIDEADASEDGDIIITAVFTHTDKEIEHLTFSDTSPHIKKVYGDPKFTNAIDETGLQGTGAITYTSSKPGIAAVAANGEVTMYNAGTTIITAHKADDDDYAHPSVSYTLEVDHKPVTVTVVIEDKTYNGDTTAGVDSFYIDGILPGDDVEYTGGTARFEDKNVGIKNVIVEGWALTGTDAANYVLAAEPNPRGDIAPQPVTLTVTINSKPYDNNTSATVNTVTVNGKIAGDIVGASGSVAFTNVNAGSRPVTCSGWALTGADAGNYELNGQPTATGTITKIDPTVTWPTGLTATVGQTLANITPLPGNIGTPGTFAWTTSATSVGVAGTRSFPMTFNPSDGTNYNAVTGSVSVTVSQPSVSIEMIWISNGTFQMGSNNSEYSNYYPSHSVTLTGFYMGKYQVTQGQYQAVMGNNRSHFSSNPAAGEVQANRPVDSVSWSDAVEFCNKLSEMEGRTKYYTINGTNVTVNPSANGYRLPTEAQWEYACRAGTTTEWSFGSSDTNIGNYAWYSSNSGSRTHEVGKKSPNAWGLYDMHGNVDEWCWDWYGDYSSSSQTNPTGPSSGTYRMTRGGSWDSISDYASSISRNFHTLIGFTTVGFRVVRP